MVCNLVAHCFFALNNIFVVEVVDIQGQASLNFYRYISHTHASFYYLAAFVCVSAMSVISNMTVWFLTE